MVFGKMYPVTLEEVPSGGGLEAGYGHNRFPDISVMLLNLSHKGQMAFVTW